MLCCDPVFCSFQFSPLANGMHTETWVLHTHPNTPQGPHQITLRGAAVGPNLLGRERRRVTAMLAEREKSSKVSLLGATVCFVAFMLVPGAVVVKSQHLMHLLYFTRSFWAAWYITRLLVKSTPKGVVFSFLPSHAPCTRSHKADRVVVTSSAADCWDNSVLCLVLCKEDKLVTQCTQVYIGLQRVAAL